jgi:hypothetical protein
MAYSLAAWFGFLLVAYASFAVVRWTRRAPTLYREVAAQELTTLRPSLESPLPAPPNAYTTQPPVYAEVA